MTRGIHLKRLTSTDLELLGLADESLDGDPDDGNDPIAVPEPCAADTLLDLRSVTREICRGLEETLRLLAD